ncbi:MAG: peroxide stress protein YaaA [Flavobacteriales bacterium]|nr:peroxide stress protein YaaA [Flavobacteriales bacterium]
MLTVLSPAKNLNEATLPPMRATSLPVFNGQALELVGKLRKLGPARLATLLATSPKLAELNHARYCDWGKALLKPAVFLYDGEAYRGLHAATLDEDDLRFAQQHLRLLSGLYGVLRPLDLIAPHRLDISTKLPVGRGIKDLYAYWADPIAEALNRALRKSGSKVLVNLASAEYFRSIRLERVEARVLTPVFKESTPRGLRTVVMHAKHQRGAMARWIIQHRLMEPEALKDYRADGYRFEPEESTGDVWLFAR